MSNDTTTTTIVFTDVVGSTELRARLGEAAADRLFIEHRRRLGTVIARHGGRLVKYLGDGVMASFAAASTAVNAAIAIQTDVAEQGHGLAVRVGVAVGDVTRDGDDYFGLPVVAAARLEAAANGGQILITEGVEPPVLSSGTGLFEHDFLVAVPNGGFPADRSLQLKIFDLGEDSRGRLIQVFNATGVSSNVPFVRINGPLPAGVTPVTIQYIVPDRQTTPAPTYQVRQLALAQPAATPGGTPIAIPPNQMSMVNGAVYLKFKTLPDRKYYIQYSSDAVTWNTSTPPLTGNGGWLVWTDNGPPKTPSRPGDQTTRFYRAFLAD